ncbi:MAG: Dna2/Cas4 domain-containing protein [Caldilineaceae bacterium SB0670_bin_27]|uniref:Dna2/Cas4 domain-containing protein n=1 Tax=Caldilineaceae bacterium SB0664_bin_27 TaxID=2605260 RepID=A0A6B0YNW9_9CHLR|nr:Dna2/Cas4 domain-containing protein [Caldilineaceae bacterium SB0664_bin_27]MYJ76932.1 Dna2/Cas4 domain-containing protein [Caldilineaceae bacterium SB0670_bin_27]
MIPSLPLALAFALLLALLGGVLLWLGRRQRESSGLPAGTVLYRDTGDWQETERPLRSRRYGLVGRPDYLVQMRDGGRRFVVPVEVKSRARPARPYDSHILQLAAYCLLVEDNFDAAPPYGLLRYADATLQIPFTDELRDRVLETATAIRTSRRAAEVRRSHAEPGRCAACGYRSACGSEALS